MVEVAVAGAEGGLPQATTCGLLAFCLAFIIYFGRAAATTFTGAKHVGISTNIGTKRGENLLSSQYHKLLILKQAIFGGCRAEALH